MKKQFTGVATDWGVRINQGPRNNKGKNQIELFRDQHGQGEMLHVIIVEQRNKKFHDKIFATLTEVYKNLDTEITFESFRHSLIMQAGWINEYVVGDDKVIVCPRSMAVHKMTMTELEALWRDMLHVLRVDYAEWLTDAVLAEIDNQMR